jgi:hypothetical protein
MRGTEAEDGVVGEREREAHRKEHSLFGFWYPNSGLLHFSTLTLGFIIIAL